MRLTEAQLQAFQEDGFVIIDDYFHDAELTAFTRALQNVIRAALIKAGLDPHNFIGREYSEAMAALEDKDHRYVAEIYDIAANLPEFLRLVSKPEHTALVNQILARPTDAPLYSMTCRCRIDPPGDTRVYAEWHQEIFFSVPESRYIQLWAPLTSNASVGKGALQVCVGSHKHGIVKQTWVEPQGRHQQAIIEPQVLTAHEQRHLELHVGQLLVFSPYLIHQSGVNASDEVRFTLIGAFHDIDNLLFQAPSMTYKYQRTPREYYEAIFGKNPH